MARSKIYGKQYKYVEPLTDTEQLVQLLNNITVKELTKKLTDHNLSTKGKRNDLLIRAQENGLLPLYPIQEEKKALVDKKLLYSDGSYLQGNPLDYYSTAQRKKLEESGRKPIIPLDSFSKGSPQYFRGLKEPDTKYLGKRSFMKEPQQIMLDVEDVPIKYLVNEPTQRKRKIHKYKVEATLRPKRNAPRAKKIKDPSDISTWPLTELRDFMREHGIKGISKNKAEIIEILQQYIS